jgi:hypothetical protein
LETIFMNSGILRRAAMPPQPITLHLMLLLMVVCFAGPAFRSGALTSLKDALDITHWPGRGK